MQPSEVLRSRARCCVVQTELQYTTSHVSGKGELSRGARRRKRKACLRSVQSSKVLRSQARRHERKCSVLDTQSMVINLPDRARRCKLPNRARRCNPLTGSRASRRSIPYGLACCVVCCLACCLACHLACCLALLRCYRRGGSVSGPITLCQATHRERWLIER